MVWCDSVSQVASLVTRNALRQKNDTPIDRPTTNRVFCFSPADVSRLDAHAQKQRRHQSSSGTPVLKLLSQGLRTLGDHFDRMQVDAFRIEWNVGSVSVDFQRLNRERNCMTLTAVVLSTCVSTRERKGEVQVESTAVHSAGTRDKKRRKADCVRVAPGRPAIELHRLWDVVIISTNNINPAFADRD